MASGKKSKSKTKQDVWKPQANKSEDLYGRTKQWSVANQPKIDAATDIAVANANSQNTIAQQQWQNDLAGGQYRDMNLSNRLQSNLNNPLSVVSQNVGSNAIGMQDVSGQQIGNLTGSAQQSAVDNFAGSNSLDALNAMIRRNAGDASNDFMSGLDSRAVASGMSGGSRQGIAQGKGLGKIQQGALDNMAQLGYTQQNQNIDRQISAGQALDSMNQQNRLANQSVDMQGQLANQQNYFNTGNSNANRAMQAAQGNQQANLQSQLANQSSQSQQAQLLSGMLGQQQQTQSNALANQQVMEGYNTAALRALMGKTSGMQFEKDIYGNPVVLSDNSSYSNSGSLL